MALASIFSRTAGAFTRTALGSSNSSVQTRQIQPMLRRFLNTTMSRKDIEFRTHDNVTIRGWLYTPSTTTPKEKKLPCLLMCHGWACLKEMGLDKFAETFVAKLPLACLVYDHRSWGSSDTAPGQPQYEIIPSFQMSDMQDAITYAQGLENIDSSKIGLWGTSYSGGHVLQVAATDKRVKAVVSQSPMVSGYETILRAIRPDLMPGIREMFQGDRLTRAAGQAAATIPVTDANPLGVSSSPGAEAFAYYTEWESKVEGKWKNQVTIRSVEAACSYDPSLMIARIAPTPLLMLVAKKDIAVPMDITLSAYQDAREPKQLIFLPYGHYDLYSGPALDHSAGKQIEFLREHLCS